MISTFLSFLTYLTFLTSQKNNRQHIRPSRLHFLPMPAARGPVCFRIAAGAVRMTFDVACFHAERQKLVRCRALEICMVCVKKARIERWQFFRRAGERTATLAERGSRAYDCICRQDSPLAFECVEECRNRACLEAAPARMQNTRNISLWRIDDEVLAIGPADAEREPGSRGDHAVSFFCSWERAIHSHRACAVHLMQARRLCRAEDACGVRIATDVIVFREEGQTKMLFQWPKEPEGRSEHAKSVAEVPAGFYPSIDLFCETK